MFKIGDKVRIHITDTRSPIIDFDKEEGVITDIKNIRNEVLYQINIDGNTIFAYEFEIIKM